MILYVDFASLFERFSIMTIDGHIPDNEALKKLKPVSAPNAYKELESFVFKQNDFIYTDT